MDGYQRRTETKKQKIRDAAFELFSAHGFDKVSLAEIAKRANVSPVSIYNYFGTKDELIKKIIATYLEDAWEQMVRLLKSDLSFEEISRK